MLMLLFRIYTPFYHDIHACIIRLLVQLHLRIKLNIVIDYVNGLR